jgi:hypothetical protein
MGSVKVIFFFSPAFTGIFKRLSSIATCWAGNPQLKAAFHKKKSGKSSTKSSLS